MSPAPDEAPGGSRRSRLGSRRLFAWGRPFTLRRSCADVRLTVYSGKDKAEIKSYIVLKVLGSSRDPVRSSAVTLDGATLTVVGTLTIAGASRSVTVPFSARGGRHDLGRVRTGQGDFAIKPFSIMIGALKVADPVEVQIQAKLPAG